MVVRFMGGLGNQMFQCAFGRSLSLARNISLFFDGTWFNSTSNGGYRKYSMGNYDVDIRFSEPKGPWYTERGLPFDANALSAPADSVFDGYWQSERYFNADVVRKDLSRPSGEPSERVKRIANAIEASRNSTFIHVRRGDYLSLQQTHGCLPLEYYSAGMRHIEEHAETQFFVFSEDVRWCRQNILGGNVTVVDPHDGEESWDIWLMSLCSHAVIANSSFSWWGAWLNPKTDGIVVAPRKWFMTKELDDRDIIPERWIRL